MITVAEIRKKLIDVGFDPNEVNTTKGKNSLLQLWKEYEETKNLDPELKDLDNVWDQEENEEKEIDTPPIYSKGWNDYVMSHFWDEELIEDTNKDKHPNIYGLRRVTQILIGDIVTARCKVVHAPTVQDNTATVEFLVRILDKDGTLKEYSDAADAHMRNLQPPYDLHLTSVATSRAESRVFRKILNLHMISHEEVVSNSPIITTNEEFITPQQLSFLNLLSERLNINALKFIESVLKIDIHGNWTKVTYIEAAEMLEKLDKLQRTKSIPEELIGYIPNWRTPNEKL